MNFTVPYGKNNSFYLTLIALPDITEIEKLDKNENVIILNPDYIISSYHILIGINRAYYNKAMKSKIPSIKREIIHSLTNENKIEISLNLHSIKNNTEKNYYILFINWKKDEIEKAKSVLKGNEIFIVNYANYINESKLMQSFGIDNKEIETTQNGLRGAIYNRLAIKQLK